MKIKTSELTGPALAWAVGTAEGDRVYRMRVARPIDWNGTDDNRWAVRAQVPNVGWFADYIYQPYIDWSQGGPIIEREGPWVRESAAASPAIAHLVTPDKKWFAYAKQSHDGTAPHCYYGETFLIAAMRCYVASKLGNEVDIPEELLS